MSDILEYMLLFALQVDFLQQKTREMERKVKEATIVREESEANLSHYKAQTDELNLRNKELELELNDVDRLAKKMQLDKNLVVKTADREMLEAKV